jgi:putative hydrolase of the HAD superfamily
VPHLTSITRAVFFDAVGTLIHPRPSAPTVYAAVAERYGLSLSAADVRERFVAAYLNEEAADVRANWLTSEARERARWHTIVCETLSGVSDAEACYRELFDHFAQPEAWEPDADAGAVLGALAARGLVLGMGSNYDARLWSVLAGFAQFDALKPRVLISSEVGARKPGAGFFSEVTRAAGCEPGEVLFVGDDLDNDYAGATNAGLRAVLLDPHARYAHVPHRAARLAQLLDEPEA